MMITVEEALKKVLGVFNVLGPERKHILDCLGQVLSADVISSLNVPPYDNSSMDGYAVRSDDIGNAAVHGPVILEVIGEVAAGHMPDKQVVAGTAMRIMTGAVIPEGADAVIQFEKTDESERKAGRMVNDLIGICIPATRGLNIRRKGEDIRKGQIVLRRGTIVKSAEVGVLASIGIGEIEVVRRPVISILSTGDELCDIGETLAPGKIYNSNAYSIAAAVLSCGGIPRIIGTGRDTVQSLTTMITEGLNSDMLITSGGVSKGDYDVVKNVLAEMGEIGFWTVRMKPGKPLAFGWINHGSGLDRGKVPCLGLPGNPVSSMMTFEQFARPAILKMMGKTQIKRPVVEAVIEDEVKNNDGRRLFSRVKLTKMHDGYHAALTGPQGSGILTSMTLADGIAVIPEDCPVVHRGEKVMVQIIDGAGDIV